MQFEDFVRQSQKKLMAELRELYKGKVAGYKKGAFLLVEGSAPILLVAHLDTVHKQPVKTICKSEDGNIIMSPEGIGGDDRCGVFALVHIYSTVGTKKPWLLFTCDEEIGGRGADTFCQKYAKGIFPKSLDKIKAIVEIDRRGVDDAVFYDCANKDFEKYIKSKGFKTQFGSFSDISYIAPDMGIAAVNLSSGYYQAHTQHEFVNLKHLNKTIERAKSIVIDATKSSFPKYKYIKKKYSYITQTRSGNYGGNYGENYGYWPDYSQDYKSLLGDYGKQYRDVYNSVPDDVPAKYRQQYDELLDIYTVTELEDWRLQFGDSIIAELYEDEFMLREDITKDKAAKGGKKVG